MTISTDVEFAIKAARFAYPSIYPDRLAILNQWFCVLGSGCDWAPDGSMDVDLEGKPEAVARVLAGELPTWDERDFSPEEWAFRARHKAYITECLGHPDTTKDDVPSVPRSTQSFYPMVERYAPLSNIPNNALPQWVLAAYETAEAIIALGAPPEVPKPSQPRLGKRGSWFRRIEQAQQKKAIREREDALNNVRIARQAVLDIRRRWPELFSD